MNQKGNLELLGPKLLRRRSTSFA